MSEKPVGVDSLMAAHKAIVAALAEAGYHTASPARLVEAVGHGIDYGCQKERARIVAWIRRTVESKGQHVWSGPLNLAYAIERGEHEE